MSISNISSPLDPATNRLICRDCLRNFIRDEFLENLDPPALLERVQWVFGQVHSFAFSASQYGNGALLPDEKWNPVSRECADLVEAAAEKLMELAKRRKFFPNTIWVRSLGYSMLEDARGWRERHPDFAKVSLETMALCFREHAINGGVLAAIPPEIQQLIFDHCL